MRRRWIILYSAIALYVVMISITWKASTRRALRQTEAMLDYAMLDLRDTLNGSIDTMLMHIGELIVEEVGPQARALPYEEVMMLAKRYDIDEINIVDRNGKDLATTDPRVLGCQYADKPDSAEFLKLTDGVLKAMSQPFRAGAHNPDVHRKYVGVAFPNGEGFVQVGMDDVHLSQMFPSIMGFIFDEWLLGETGFFLCADLKYGRLISNPARHRDEAKFLGETGYDQFSPLVHEDGKTSFRQCLFGDICDCRALIFCGYRIIAALPPAEFYVTRNVYTMVIAVVMAVILGFFVLLLWRINADSARLKAFYEAESEKQAAELELGKSIQMSVLPGDIRKNDNFQFVASMIPAREVGGDFYDFFSLDEMHKAFLVADVSGKGITGALYMMNAKTLIKNILMESKDFNPALALEYANAELCGNNSVEMFVTVWVGILDLETGRVVFANAGHNPPLCLRGGQPPQWLRERSGYPLACFDNASYKQLEITLAPGDSLFLYTDGVTEAMNAKGELFGEARLEEALTVAREAEACTPNQLVKSVRQAVHGFVDNAPQADDLTILAVQFISAPKHQMRTFSCCPEATEAAADYLRTVLEAEGCPQKDVVQLLIALDEVVSNVVKFSGASGFAVEVSFTQEPKGVSVSVSDDGTPFNPLHNPDPDTTLSVDERSVGGLGILLLRKMMDYLSYHHAHGCNILTFKKKF